MSAPTNHLSAEAPEFYGEQLPAAPQPAENVRTMTRVLNIHVAGSLTRLSQDGESAGRWAVMDGKQASTFCDPDSSADTAGSANALRGVTITRARLLQQKNGLPYNVGVNVSCLPRHESVDTGHSYTYTALPFSEVQIPHTLYEADSLAQESLRWRTKYKAYNAANLETEGILELKQCPYVFVSRGHPVIDVLRANQELLGSNIDDHLKFDNEYYKLSRTVLSKCCSALRSRVLNKIATHDLNQFHVTLERTSGMDWLGIDEGAVALADFDPTKYAIEDVPAMQQRHIDNFISKEYQYSARLELTYEMHS